MRQPYEVDVKGIVACKNVLPPDVGTISFMTSADRLKPTKNGEGADFPALAAEVWLDDASADSRRAPRRAHRRRAVAYAHAVLTLAIRVERFTNVWKWRACIAHQDFLVDVPTRTRRIYRSSALNVRLSLRTGPRSLGKTPFSRQDTPLLLDHPRAVRDFPRREILDPAAQSDGGGQLDLQTGSGLHDGGFTCATGRAT